MGLIVISGARGQGKTTLLCSQVAAAGQNVGGIASPAVFEGGRRIGYDVLDLRSGARRPLARETTSPKVTPSVGVYHFDEDAIAEGNAAVIEAVQRGCDLIAIDEIGLLELDGRGWAPALTLALAARRPQQELILVVRASIIDALPERFPSNLWASARRVSPP